MAFDGEAVDSPESSVARFRLFSSTFFRVVRARRRRASNPTHKKVEGKGSCLAGPIIRYMVGTLTWVLVGLAAYTLVAMALRDRELLPEFVKISGPITTLHTQKGKIILTKLAAPTPRFPHARQNRLSAASFVKLIFPFWL